MEHSFNKLEIEGKNNMQTLMGWLLDAKLISPSERIKVTIYFEQMAEDLEHVALGAFKQVLAKIADDQGRDFHYVVKYLGFDLLKKSIISAVRNSSRRGHGGAESPSQKSVLEDIHQSIPWGKSKEKSQQPQPKPEQPTRRR